MRRLVCCFVSFYMVLVPILGTPSPTVYNCLQRQLSPLLPWNLRKQVANGTFDVLNLERPKYLDNFKNPCWYETTPKGNELRCLPYFFIAGWPKCGTTDLWVRIGQHPNVSTNSLRKEQHWWTVWRYQEKMRSIDHYINLFKPSTTDIKENPVRENGRTFYPMVTGEGSPDTFWKTKRFREIPQNCLSDLEPTFTNAHLIKHLLPKAKIIVTLRNPVKHLMSMYLFFGKQKKTAEEFHNICVKEINKWNHCIQYHTWRQCAHDMSEYQQQRFRSTIYVVFLRDWFKVFPREQIYVNQLEEYGQNEVKAMNNIFNFLELGPVSTPGLIRKIPVQNERHKNPNVKMLEKTRILLEDFFKPYNHALSTLLEDEKWLYDSV